ncbi:hypothetical protein L596_025490 [Steinernema carpocapsae]|uniref:C2 domain-containing protein n=1 Tax=Steinernema carpocapsae TaxID=34508 RepID=A0A4U5M7X9_STECR|nr:hypothetical protein L596_025490 [Steinernema carpocapsae]
MRERHPITISSLISLRDDISNHYHQLTSITVELKDVKIPNGNHMTAENQGSTYYIKYQFPCYESVSKRLMQEQIAQGTAVSAQRIDFSHNITVNINCGGKDDIGALWAQSVLKVYLMAGRTQLGVAKVPLSELLKSPFSIRKSIFFRTQETTLHPSAQIRIELNSTNSNFMDQLLAVRREVLVNDPPPGPIRCRTRSATSRRPSTALSRPGSANVFRPPSSSRTAPPAPIKQGPSSLVSSISIYPGSDDVFLPSSSRRSPSPRRPPLHRRPPSPVIPVYISPPKKRQKKAESEPPAPPPRPQYRSLRVKVISAKRIPKQIVKGRESRPATFVTVESETDPALRTHIVRNTSSPVWNWIGVSQLKRSETKIVLRLKHQYEDGKEEILGAAVVDWMRGRGEIQHLQMKSNLITDSLTGSTADAFPILKVQIQEEDGQASNVSSVSSSVPSESASLLGGRLKRTLRTLDRQLRCD